ncbi:hypothetical protein GJ744_005374 [Endocarpon pusillum]|uniref:Uncharacterized protein n=1 Tax=Endocarpon pusillum TaxID=364733 RepID=A0A8H7ALB8_9EURO|nr:hypothetical protein GJ744_005374 [Endocarpon pusillum]
MKMYSTDSFAAVSLIPIFHQIKILIKLLSSKQDAAIGISVEARLNSGSVSNGIARKAIHFGSAPSQTCVDGL